MKYDEAEQLIKNYREDGELPATLYVPKKEFHELDKEYHEKEGSFRNQKKIKGVKYKYDASVKDPIILPDDFGDIPTFLTDPPEKKVRELIKIEKESWEDVYHQTTNTRYGTRVFLKPYCVWQRFNQDVIEKYGHPLSNPNISMKRDDEPHDFTKTDFNHCKRQKFAVENRVTAEMEKNDIKGMYGDEENVETQLANSIHNFLWSVQAKPVYAERKWSYEMPTAEVPTPSGEPIVVEHSEEIKIGEKYTTYESLFMKKLDVESNKLQLKERNGDK